MLAAGGNFINGRGGDAVTVAGSGRWLIYSNALGGDAFGNLDSGNTAIWNADLRDAAARERRRGSGSRYLFAFQPTLTFTSTDVTKTFGDDGPPRSRQTPTTGDDGPADSALPAPSLATRLDRRRERHAVGDLGGHAATTAGVGGRPYHTITVAQGSLVSLARYALRLHQRRKIHGDAAPWTVMANDESKVAGNTFTFNGTELAASGLVNGDTVTSATLTSSGTPASATATGSPYAIVASNALGNGLSNHDQLPQRPS